MKSEPIVELEIRSPCKTKGRRSSSAISQPLAERGDDLSAKISKNNREVHPRGGEIRKRDIFARRSPTLAERFAVRRPCPLSSAEN